LPAGHCHVSFSTADALQAVVACATTTNSRFALPQLGTSARYSGSSSYMFRFRHFMDRYGNREMHLPPKLGGQPD
jgi:hypothetical protein